MQITLSFSDLLALATRIGLSASVLETPSNVYITLNVSDFRASCIIAKDGSQASDYASYQASGLKSI